VDIDPMRVTCDNHMDDTYKFHIIFGPDTLQSEVFLNVCGLVQSAVDGYNTLIMACGPAGGGKSYTMFGELYSGGTESARGIIPRVVDELYAIRDRDNWRALLEIDVQMVAIDADKRIIDLMKYNAAHPDSGSGPFVRFQSQASGIPEDMSIGEAIPYGCNVVIDGACTRRMANKQEFRRKVQDKCNNPAQRHQACHVLLFVHLMRTNRATGTISKSKLVLVDLASFGQGASSEIMKSYDALGAVFKSLSRGDSHVPFRDHVLTQVLQDCMGGTAKTMLLLAISPNHHHSDSLKAIQFATCAKW